MFSIHMFLFQFSFYISAFRFLFRFPLHMRTQGGPANKRRKWSLWILQVPRHAGIGIGFSAIKMQRTAAR